MTKPLAIDIQTANEIVRRFALTSNVMCGGKLVAQQVVVAEAISNALMEVRLDYEEALADLKRDLAEARTDAERYRYLRSRPEDTIGKGGIFAGMTPATGKGGYILTEDDLDRAVDGAVAEEGRRADAL